MSKNKIIIYCYSISLNGTLVLTDEEFRALMDFIVKTREEGKIVLSYGCEGYLGEYEGLVRNHHYSCRAGLTSHPF